MTQYNDEYPTCERTSAELRIYSTRIGTEELVRLISLMPTEIQTKGEVRTTSQGRTRTIKINGWFFSSESSVISKDSRRHLDWLLDRIEPLKPELSALQQQDGVTMAVFCSWWSAYGHGGPTLWPEQMTRLGALGLELTFDISFFDDDNDGYKE